MKSRVTPWALACFALVAAALVDVDVPLWGAVLHEGYDMAANSLRVQEARRGELLTGNYSRLGFHHPGPAILYVLAAGEQLFHHSLGWTASPIVGQAVAASLYNAAWIAMLFALLARASGSLAASAAACAAFVAALALADPRYLHSLWFPFLYTMPFAVLLAAIAPITRGQTWPAWQAALAAGFLVHGHAAFIPIVGIVVAAAAVTAARAPSWQVSRASLAAAAVIATTFAAPIVLDFVLHFPGELPKYAVYGVRNAPQAWGAAAAFTASFWGGFGGWALAAALLAGLAWRPASAPTRALLLGVVVASVAVVLYARYGIDDLRHRYTAFFYAAAVALSVSVITLEAAMRLPWRAAIGAGFVLAGIGIAISRLEPTVIEEAPAAPALAAALARVSPAPAVLDLDVRHDWPVTWGLVVAAAAQADRRGERPFCVRDNWHVVFTVRFRCTPRDVAAGTRLEVGARQRENAVGYGGVYVSR